MGYVGTKPTAAPLTSAQLEDGLVTAAKLATDAVETAKVKDLNVTVAKLPAAVDISTKTVTLPASVSGLGTGITNSQLAGSIDVTSKITGVVPAANLGSGTASVSTFLAGNQTYQTIAEYDDSVVQSNIAMLGFKVAVNGSLTRYNLVDQSIDEFFDTSGVDASASTNEIRSAPSPCYYYGGADGAPTGADSTDTSVAGFTTLVCSAATGSIVVGTAGSVDMLVVAGGGAGGSRYGGGGGAGGLIYKTGHGLTVNTYDWVRGAGGVGQSAQHGLPGADSTWTINGGATEFTAKGGGGGGSESSPQAASDGGSGGGATYADLTGQGTETQTGQAGDSGTYGFGNDGGTALYSPSHNPGGGGGAGSAGANATVPQAGDGGTGKDYSTIFGTALGDSGWFASGGGGSHPSTPVGTASSGGGSDGVNTGATSVTGQANTGGGSGGGGGPTGASGPGGTGVILVRYADGAFTTPGGNLTLQSTDVTAEAEPDFGEFVTLIENAYGTATLNTDIKGYVSRDSGVTFTQGTLVDEGTWGTNKQILGFHDLDISSQPSGTSMCYKIETLNQSESSKETRIYATSIGWR